MKLKEVVKICYGKNQKDVEVTFSNIPILGTGGIIGYSSKFIYNKESVLIGRKGTIGTPFYINKPFWTIDTLFYTKVNTKIIIPKFLYYLLCTIDLNKFSEGAAVPSLTVKTLNDIELFIPNKTIQQHIVNTIGSVDDLIENKQKIVSFIKQFRSKLFLKYSSESNSVIEILNLIKLEGGAQPPKEDHIYSKKDGYVRFVQNRDYHTDGHLTYIPVSKRNHLCTETDIMMDKYGEAGSIRYGIAGAYNVALTKIISKTEINKEYIRDFLSQTWVQELLASSSQASTRSSLNESTFIGLNIPMIDNDQMKKYNGICGKLLKMELKIKDEILVLNNIKKSLLDKYFN